MSEPTQVDIFAEELTAHADPQRPNYVVVSADATTSLRLGAFAARHPDRVVQVGIAEATALGTAFGLARTGLKVFVAGYGSFLLMRGLEVIRSHIAYHRADVTILGGMMGLTASYDGFMHQSVEDVGLMRTIDGIEILVPSDEATTRRAARACLERPGPRYVRLVRRPLLMPEALDRTGDLVWRSRAGDRVLLCSFGAALVETIEAAKLLAARGLAASVLEVGTVAPLPRVEILAAAARFQRIVVVEDHLPDTGLAAALADVLYGVGPPIQRLGISARSMGSGRYEDLVAAAGLDAARIAEVVLSST
jgi:transketolase